MIEYNRAKTSEEVLFGRPVIVEAVNEYSVYANLSGSNTYYGSNGTEHMPSGKLAMSFFKRSKTNKENF